MIKADIEKGQVQLFFNCRLQNLWKVSAFILKVELKKAKKLKIRYWSMTPTRYKRVFFLRISRYSRPISKRGKFTFFPTVIKKKSKTIRPFLSSSRHIAVWFVVLDFVHQVTKASWRNLTGLTAKCLRVNARKWDQNSCYGWKLTDRTRAPHGHLPPPPQFRGGLVRCLFSSPNIIWRLKA